MVVKESAVLLVTDAVALSGTVVSWALQAFEDKVVAGKSLAIVTQASSLGIVGKLEANSSSYDAIISLARTPGYHSSGCLVELAQMLKPGGRLVVQEPLDMTANGVVGVTVTMSCQTEASLKRNILFAGLIEAETKEALENILPAADVGSPGLQSIMVSSKKPVWETGSSFAIKKKEIRKPAASNGTTVRLSFDETISVEARGIVLPNTNGTLDLKDLGFDNDDDELIDEDALLTEEDLRRPELPKDDDCEVGNAGRKACKNCTCGRAELEEKAELTTDMLANPQSACGNCGLGDAFRCNGCPYRGLPPFKIGEKISLSEAFLTADV